jgi:hypothetical protein
MNQEGLVGQTFTEADLFHTFWDDGLLDLLAGAALLVTGVGWAIGIGPLAVLQAPLWGVVWPPLHRRLVEPRAGFVEFSRSRQERTRRGLWQALGDGVRALAVVGLLFLLVREGAGSASLPELVAGLPAMLVAVAACVAGVLTSARRFYGYAVVLVVGAAATVVLHLGPAMPLVVAGGVVALTGLSLLIRFVRGSRELLEGE